MLTGAVLVVGGLELVRGFTAPAVMGAGFRDVVALLAGFVLVVVAWPAVAGVIRVVDSSSGTSGLRQRLHEVLRPDHPADLRAGPSAVLAVLATAGLALLALFPLRSADWLGVVGLVTVAMTCLATLASLAILQSQDRARRAAARRAAVVLVRRDGRRGCAP